MNDKRRTKKQMVLERLLDGKPHHMRELNQITFRYGGRIHELRKQGYNIVTLKVGEDEFAYCLMVPEEKRQVAMSI